jgi:hypothetical protein
MNAEETSFAFSSIISLHWQTCLHSCTLLQYLLPIHSLFSTTTARKSYITHTPAALATAAAEAQLND